MNRDTLDNGLREKLGHARVEPPSDMWNRIAATLQEQGLTEEQPVAGTPAPNIRIRRPRRMRFGYAAAAVAVVCVAVFALWRLSPDNVVLSQEEPPREDITILTPDQIEQLIATTTADDTPEPPVQEKVRGAVRSMVAGDKAGAGQRTLVAEAVAVTGPAGTETTSDASAGAETQTSEIVNTDTQNTAAGTPDTNQEPPSRGRNTSDIGRGVPVDYPGPGPKPGKEKRRAEPVNIGVYSSNLGSTGSEKVVNTRSNVKASSDFAVTETSSNSAIYGSASQKSTVKLKHKMPISGGVSVTKGLTGRLSLETGVTYTYMHSESEQESSTAAYDIERKLHYVGVPVGVKYDFLQSRHVDLYASASALFEMCASGKDTKKLRSGGITGGSETESLNVRGIQPSIGVHLGAEVKLARNVGLYVEPGMNYYFDTDKQPESYRTENPLNFSLRAGLRFSLK